MDNRIYHDDKNILYIGDSPVGVINQEVDGFYQYYSKGTGYLEPQALRLIADYIDSLNIEIEVHLEKYFTKDKGLKLGDFFKSSSSILDVIWQVTGISCYYDSSDENYIVGEDSNGEYEIFSESDCTKIEINND